MLQAHIHKERLVLQDDSASDGGVFVGHRSAFFTGRTDVRLEGDVVDLIWSTTVPRDTSVVLLRYEKREIAEQAAKTFGQWIAVESLLWNRAPKCGGWKRWMSRALWALPVGAACGVLLIATAPHLSHWAMAAAQQNARASAPSPQEQLRTSAAPVQPDASVVAASTIGGSRPADLQALQRQLEELSKQQGQPNSASVPKGFIPAE